MEHIQGPDFPTGGIIYDVSEIKMRMPQAAGRSSCGDALKSKTLARQKRDYHKRASLPGQQSAAGRQNCRSRQRKKIDGISDLRDESDRRGIRVYVELKRDAKPKQVLNNLYKHTNLQTTFPVNMVALVDNTPQTCSLKLILEEYIKHRHDVVRKRSEFELKEARAREHILEGLKIAVDHIDEVIAIIKKRKCRCSETKLMTRFKLSEIQSTAILDMQLRRLAALERQKIEDELAMIPGDDCLPS